jgi:hypothetical protein
LQDVKQKVKMQGHAQLTLGDVKVKKKGILARSEFKVMLR